MNDRLAVKLVARSVLEYDRVSLGGRYGILTERRGRECEHARRAVIVRALDLNAVVVDLYVGQSGVELERDGDLFVVVRGESRQVDVVGCDETRVIARNGKRRVLFRKRSYGKRSLLVEVCFVRYLDHDRVARLEGRLLGVLSLCCLGGKIYDLL